MTYPFFIRVEHHAAPMPPDESVRVLARDANRMGMTLMCSINGIEVMAVPGTDPEALAIKYRDACRLTEKERSKRLVA